MMQQPTRPVVSVIIPVHNRFEMLRRAVASVVDQTHRGVQLIVVDDASATALTLSDVLVPDGITVQVLRLEANGGPGAAREAGRARATGEFIAYLDSDDYWAPEFLCTLVEALRGAQDAGMAYCTALDIEDGTVSGVCKASDESYGAILPRLLYGRPWHTSSCLWRREVVDRIGPWRPLWCWEDYEYDCRAGCLDTRIVHVTEGLCFVQRDAPNRVSVDASRWRTMASRTAAVNYMADGLGQTRWADDRSVRRRMRELLLSNAMDAARLKVAGETWRSAARGLTWQRSWLGGLCAILPLGALAGLIVLRRWDWAVRALGWLRRQVSGVRRDADSAPGRM